MHSIRSERTSYGIFKKWVWHGTFITQIQLLIDSVEIDSVIKHLQRNRL